MVTTKFRENKCRSNLEREKEMYLIEAINEGSVGYERERSLGE
jgi:hypothetical protein